MSQALALFLAADVYYRFQDPATGQFGNRIKVETEKLEIKTSSDLKEKLSKGRETYGQTFVSHRVPKPTEFSLTFSQLTKEIFAMQLSGVTETVNEAVKTLTDVAVTVVLDEWVKIDGYANLATAGLTVKDSLGTTTYVLGTDYQINPRLGLIKALSGGAITAGPVHVNGTTLAVKGTRIIGARQYATVLSFEVDGVNQITGKNVTLNALQAKVSAEDAHDFLSGDLESAPLKGRLEIPEGGDRPFDMVIYD